MAEPRIFIPVVLRSKSPHDYVSKSPDVRLWEVSCRVAEETEINQLPTLDNKNWEPTVHPLGKLGRYDSGMNGLEAVRRLLRGSSAEAGGITPLDLEEDLRRRRVCGEGADWVKRIEDNSSDLGLGLALLIDVMQAQTPVLAATGELGRAEEAKSDSPNDLPVKPVGDIRAKLQAILDKKRGDSDGVLSQLAMVFTPAQYYAENGELALVEQLDEFKQLNDPEGLGVSVHPINSFGEAAKILGIDLNAQTELRRASLAREAQKRWLAQAGLIAAGLGLAAMLVLGGGLLAFLNRPIPLQWSPMERHAPQAEPFLACIDNGQTRSQQALAKAGAMPIAPVTSSQLSWLARIGQRDEADSWQHPLLSAAGYRGYHLAVVLIGKSGDFSGNSVFIPRLSQASTGAEARPSPGAVWSYGIDLKGPAEENRLVLLVNRWQAFDAETLRKDLQRQFKPGTDGLDLPAVENYLKRQANVTLPFTFQIRDDAPGCPPHS